MMNKLTHTFQIIIGLVLVSMIWFACTKNTGTSTKTNTRVSSANGETIILVHSAWLGAWQWDQVKTELEQQGHTVITPDLPGHGSNAKPAASVTMNDYVDMLVQIIDQQDQEVILLGHSFNGITVSQVAERRPDNIKSLVYLTAFLLEDGASFFKAVQGAKGSEAVDNFYLSDDKTEALVKQEAMWSAFAHDIPEDAFKAALPNIVPEPAAPLGYELDISKGKFGQIPKYYIECTLDRALPIGIQRAMYEGHVQQVYSLESSHTPNFSKPKELAGIIHEIAQQDTNNWHQKITHNLKYSRSQNVYRGMFDNVDVDKQFQGYYTANGRALNLHRFFMNEDHALAHLESEIEGETYAEMILLELNEKGQPHQYFTAIQKVPGIERDNHSMFDGSIVLIQDGNTEKNKAFIQRFLNEVWISGKFDELEYYFDKGRVIQHNPQVADHTEGLYEFMAYMQEKNISLQYDKVLATFAQGNMVMTYSEGSINGEAHVFADLFRIENGKIAEHWDVIQKKP